MQTPISRRQLIESLAITLICALAPMGQAQPTSETLTNAAPRFGQTFVSPEVNADRTVTFRVRAPNAKEVTVSGEWGGGNKALNKGNDGVWSATIGPIEPNLYGYGFSIDGFRTADPANSSIKPMRSPTTSILDVPGVTPALHDFVASIPHGTVREHWYDSKALGRRRSLHVYTPPGYDKKTLNRYPVLYLFHGSGDSDATWTTLGRAQCIADNLLAQGKAKPMIIVMTDGHAVPPTAGGGRGGGGGATNAPNRNVQEFERDLLQDVMPFVEVNYRVRANPQNRAIVGLSMGGGQSLTIGINHPELFAWVGGMSSALRNADAAVGASLAKPAELNKRLKLLWFACGKDDTLIGGARQLSATLKEKNVRHEFRETEGNHSWPVWRRYLGEFMPLLFAENR